MARGRKAETPATEETVAEVKETKTVKASEAEVKEVDKRDEEIALLKEQLAAMKSMVEQLQNTQPTQVIQVNTPESERILFLFEAEVADDNVFTVGENGMYGRITGKTGSFYVPKSDLSRVMDSQFRAMLDARWIVAVNGLTDEERDAYGINYKEGEYLDKRAFAKMVELGDEMLEIYPKLCAGHKEMVAKRYYEAYKAGNPKVTRDLIVKLNQLSKEAGNGKGDFAPIIELMNAAEAE